MTTRVERKRRRFWPGGRESAFRERLRCSVEPKDVWSAFGESVSRCKRENAVGEGVLRCKRENAFVGSKAVVVVLLVGFGGAAGTNCESSEKVHTVDA